MAAVAAVTTPAAAVVANTSRLDTTILRTPLFGRGDFALAWTGDLRGIRAFADAHDHTNVPSIFGFLGTTT
jgi:hypothetical protein